MQRAARTVAGAGAGAWRLLLAAGLALGAGPCSGCFGGGTPAPSLAPPVGAAPAATSAEAAAPAAHYGIRVQLVHDGTTGVTTYQVDESPPADEAALAAALEAAETEWNRTHRTRATVRIEAAKSVPWKDVVALVNACKAAGLEKVEFDFEGRPR